jgi:hypothetical protein
LKIPIVGVKIITTFALAFEKKHVLQKALQKIIIQKKPKIFSKILAE